MNLRTQESKVNLRYIFTEVLLIVVGILIAISLNDWVAARKLKTVSKRAIENIKAETSGNLAEIKQILALNRRVLAFYNEPIDFILSKSLDQSQIKEKISKVEMEFEGVIEISGILEHSDSTVILNADLNADVQLAELSDIAWQAAKVSGVVDVFSYDQLGQILSIYDIQSFYVDEQSKLIDAIVEDNFSSLKRRLSVCNQLAEDLQRRYEVMLQADISNN